MIKKIHISIKIEKSNITIDMLISNKIILDTKLSNGTPLNRECLWQLDKQKDFIHSLLIGRHISPISIMIISEEAIIIDGRKRIDSILNYTKNEFSIMIDNKEYYFKDLSTETQNSLLNQNLDCFLSTEKLSDKEMVDWFSYLNPPDTSFNRIHLDNLYDSFS